MVVVSFLVVMLVQPSQAVNPNPSTLNAAAREGFKAIKAVRLLLHLGEVDVRLPGKVDSNSHGARPVHLIITIIKWTRTSRLSINNSLSERSCTGRVQGDQGSAAAAAPRGRYLCHTLPLFRTHTRIHTHRRYAPRYTLNPTHPTPSASTLHPTPYALHPTPYALRPTPYTLHPTHYTLHTTP